nr:hypothetical protein HmN_000362300 [Hymenolepis microstoma]
MESNNNPVPPDGKLTFLEARNFYFGHDLEERTFNFSTWLKVWPHKSKEYRPLAGVLIIPFFASYDVKDLLFDLAFLFKQLYAASTHLSSCRFSLIPLDFPFVIGRALQPLVAALTDLSYGALHLSESNDIQWGAIVPKGASDWLCSFSLQ